MPERSVCVLDMALYKTLYILSHCLLSCETDCFTICLSLPFVNALNKRIYLFAVNTERSYRLLIQTPMLLCVIAVKCAVDASLRKTRLTHATETNRNFVEASHTMTSSCNPQGQNERLEDGLTTESIKCTDVSSTGKWSHGEYSCAGICNAFSL